MLSARIMVFAQRYNGSGGLNQGVVEVHGDRVLLRVRKWNGRTLLELVNLQFRQRGTGHATRLLEYLEACMPLEIGTETKIDELVVASVSNMRFARFLERRGWNKDMPTDCYPSLCFDVRASRRDEPSHELPYGMENARR